MLTYREAMHEAARGYLQDVLREANGKVFLAAMIAGVNRTHFYKLLERVGPDLLPSISYRYMIWNKQRQSS